MRWMLFPWVDAAFLYASQVGPVAPAERRTFGAWLWARQPWAGDHSVEDWLQRTDVVRPDEVFGLVEEELHKCPNARYPRPLLVGALLQSAAVPGAHRARSLSLALHLAADLSQEARRELLARLSDEALFGMLSGGEVGDDLERQDGDAVLGDLVRALAVRPGARHVQLCLELVGRAPEAGFAWGGEIVDTLHTANERVARNVFRAVGSDRNRGFAEGTSAATMMALALEDGRTDVQVLVTLVGRVKVRPQALNRVGTEVMRRRRVPVTIDGETVGFAVTEQYPVLGTTDVRFEAILDPAFVPVAWHGATLPLLEVRQGTSWPGPPPLELRLARDVVPLESPRSR
jgi:hypothetical protein